MNLTTQIAKHFRDVHFGGNGLTSHPSLQSKAFQGDVSARQFLTTKKFERLDSPLIKKT